MKAKLLLRVDGENESEVNLLLSIPNRERFLHGIKVNDNMEDYKNALEEIINESTLWKNSIPGLNLLVNNSVIDYIEGEEEEIRKFISMLVTEM